VAVPNAALAPAVARWSTLPLSPAGAWPTLPGDVTPRSAQRWTTFAVALAPIIALALVACGGRTPLNLVDDGGPGVGDDDDDAPPDGGLDAGDDDDDDDDDEAFRFTVEVTELVQNCMPVIPPDNVLFEATLLLRNGSSPLPETEVETIEVLNGDRLVATFEPSEATRVVPALSPGERRDLELRKATPSLEPPVSCTLCGSTSRPDILRVVLRERDGMAIVAQAEARIDLVLMCLG